MEETWGGGIERVFFVFGLLLELVFLLIYFCVSKELCPLAFYFQLLLIALIEVYAEVIVEFPEDFAFLQHRLFLAAGFLLGLFFLHS